MASINVLKGKDLIKKATTPKKPATPKPPAKPQASVGTFKPTLVAPPDVKQKLKALGLSDETIAGMTLEQLNTMAAVGEVISKQYEQGNPVPQFFTTADLDRMFQEAQNDPSIDAYYKEQLRIGQQEVLQNVATIQQDYEALQKQQQREQPLEQTALAEQEAAVGRAFSGFRQQAQEKLKEEQKGVVESSRNQAKQALRAQLNPFEQKFGSQAVQGLNVPEVYGQVYAPIGNVPGSQEQAKLLDIRAKESELQNRAALTRGL